MIIILYVFNIKLNLYVKKIIIILQIKIASTISIYFHTVLLKHDIQQE